MRLSQCNACFDASNGILLPERKPVNDFAAYEVFDRV